MGNASTLSNSFNGFRNAPSRRALVVGISYAFSPRVAFGSRCSDMIITGVENDLSALANWTSKFEMHTKVYHDGIKERQPKAHTIRKLMKETVAVPTVLYLSGHGVTINGENVYLPVDCIKRNQLAADKAISYSEMRTLLAAQSNAAPLVVVTDFCNCDNFLQLPYVLKMEGDEPIWRETEYQGDKHRNSNSIIAHFSPGCQAGTWPKPSSCRMFTQEFFNVSPSEKLSLYGIMERLKSNVGQIRNDHDPGNGSYLHQQYKVYCSHKFDHAHFFDALGFKLSIAETCYGGTPI